MKTGKQAAKRSRTPIPFVLAGLVVAAGIGVGVFFAVRGGSSSSTQSQPPAVPNPLDALRNHQLLLPECKPVPGPRWHSPGVTLITSRLYEVFAINMPCGLAKTWTVKIARVHIPIKHSGNLSKLHGPAGWSCEGWPDKYGLAYAGGCRKGRQAFGWNWNVADRRVVFVPTEQGGYTLQKLAGSDAETIVRPLSNGHYQLDVLNTSGVGYLDSFTWAPPAGLQVTRIAHVSGADCTLVGGAVSCVANLHPPGCICAGDGGELTIELTLVPRSKSKAQKGITYGTQGSNFVITKMTPVPYLIPGTPQEARKRGGL